MDVVSERERMREQLTRQVRVEGDHLSRTNSLASAPKDRVFEFSRTIPDYFKQTSDSSTTFSDCFNSPTVL